MSRARVPSMPTEKQVKTAYEFVSRLHPDARISRIGPDGVTFDYGDTTSATNWADQPFIAEVANEK